MKSPVKSNKILSWATLSLMAISSLGNANPLGGQVTAGSAKIIQTTPQRMNVVQHSDHAAINWQSFSVNRHGHVNFRQPSPQSTTLNRVVGQDPSNILGRVSSNGKVFLLNPNGILFGKGSKIDVGGLVATTSNISDADFMAGRYHFENPSNTQGRVVNHGEITAKANGLVALVAPGVNNTGIINAKLGRVTLAAGQKFTLDLYGDQLVKLAVDDSLVNQVKDSNGNAVNAGVRHSGKISADGGQVVLAATTAREAVDNVINMNGIIRARSVTQDKGEIILDAGDKGTVQVSGVLDSSGKQVGMRGGNIKVLGDQVNLKHKARIDASGAGGGGDVLVGGDFQGKGSLPTATKTVVSQGATIKADAITRGNGGKVIVWADGETQYSGHISAKGGSKTGNGGLAEVSGKQNLVYRGDSTLSAPHGKAGTLLLDPLNITVSKTGSNTLNGAATTIKAQTISETMGKGTSVKLSATNDITVKANIDSRFKDAKKGAGISLTAGNNINLKANIKTNNGAIAVTTTDGSINMDARKVLFAGNKPISLTAGNHIAAQNLVTSGDVTLASRQGSINLGKDLGGTPKFALGKLTINADQGAISMKAVRATKDIQVTAQKNVDVNGPIQSAGGAITLTSRGSNTDQTAINLNHNLYTNGKDITLDGDVLLNPTAEELITLLNGDEPGPTNNVCPTCDANLCPTCELIDKNDPGKGVIFKTKSDALRYIRNSIFNPPNSDGTKQEFIKGFNNTDKLADAENRLASLLELFSVREVTVNSNGGNIFFKKEVRRETGSAFDNFKKAFNISDLSVIDSLGSSQTGTFVSPEFSDVVFRDSFKHHALKTTY